MKFLTAVVVLMPIAGMIVLSHVNGNLQAENAALRAKIQQLTAERDAGKGKP